MMHLPDRKLVPKAEAKHPTNPPRSTKYHIFAYGQSPAFSSSGFILRPPLTLALVITFLGFVKSIRPCSF